MIRAFGCALLALFLGVVTLSAKDWEGTITKVDADKKIVTVKVGDTEVEVTISDKVAIKGGKDGDKDVDLSKLSDRVGKKAAKATITTKEDADAFKKDLTITNIRVRGGKGK
jgi:hypothetical protein